VIGAARTGVLAGVHVLVADDCPDNRRLLVHHLERQGAVAQGVASGWLAVGAAERRLGEGGFDAVVLDLQMPELDGWETARRLRALGYGGRLLAVSAGDSESPERLSAAGFDRWMGKPVDPAELVDAVRRVALRPGREAA
jgi:CheY-like chemotaxis protein